MSKPKADSVKIHAFMGACLLTGAILVPQAPLIPVLIGMVLAGVVQWTWNYYRGAGTNRD